MPSKQFTIDSSGIKRLEISYKGYYKNFTVAVDGKPLGTILNDKELEKGKSFSLPDKSVLDFKLIKQELVILKNGKPLPGTAADPVEILKVTSFFIMFLGGINVCAGLLEILFTFSFLTEAGIGIFSIAVGVIVTALGYFVKRKSIIALTIAIAILCADILFTFIFGISVNSRPDIAVIGAKVILLLPCLRGFKAIKALKHTI